MGRTSDLYSREHLWVHPSLYPCDPRHETYSAGVLRSDSIRLGAVARSVCGNVVISVDPQFNEASERAGYHQCSRLSAYS